MFYTMHNKLISHGSSAHSKVVPLYSWKYQNVERNAQALIDHQLWAEALCPRKMQLYDMPRRIHWKENKPLFIQVLEGRGEKY